MRLEVENGTLEAKVDGFYPRKSWIKENVTVKLELR